MEVKINREIRAYKETIFFGLTLRQCLFTALALSIAVGLFFLLRGFGWGIEPISWVCILVAAPFVLMGFITYHGMTAEQFLIVWLRSELLTPKQLLFKPRNRYFELLCTDKEMKRRLYHL